MSAFELWHEFTIEVSHTLDDPIGIPVIHGHSYWIKVFVESSIENPMPLPRLAGLCGLVQHKLDHKHLNDLMPIPTMESLAQWVYEQIQVKATRIDIKRKSIGAGITFYPEAHGASYWRARCEHKQFEAQHMAKSVKYAWDMVSVANKRLEANNLKTVHCPRDEA